jgi:hypothetical protein
MEIRPLSGDEIKTLIAAVAERLDPNGDQHVLIIVGGSLLAWNGMRGTTDDVDSVSRLNEELRTAVEKVALENDLAPDWLNANAAPFRPNSLDVKACDQLLDHPRLLVLGAPIREVFLMKMYRAWPNDQADMVTMWPHTGFTSLDHSSRL